MGKMWARNVVFLKPKKFQAKSGAPYAQHLSLYVLYPSSYLHHSKTSER